MERSKCLFHVTTEYDEMSFDFSELTPAPWLADGYLLNTGTTSHGPILMPKNQAQFCALARNAFDVMMRRGWSPYRRINGNWDVQDSDTGSPIDGLPPVDEWGSCPFTALVEADKWYREHIE